MIRPEEPADAEAVARVHTRSWQHGYAGILPDELLATIDPAARARARMETPPDSPFTTLVAECDGEIAGFVTYGPYRRKHTSDPDPEFGEILAIYVDPPHWGAGVGSVLMRAALDALPQPEARLWVLEKNVAAQAFYRKHGLDPDGTADHYRPRGSEIDFPELRFAIVRGRDEKQG